LRKLDLGVQQGAIDINGDKADGVLHSFILSSDGGSAPDCRLAA
jgi:hypothetical protein